MLKLIEIHFLKGWTRQEKKDFFITLFITLALIAGLLYFSMVWQSPIRQHDTTPIHIENVA